MDVNPGDRASKCRGMMKPIGIYTLGKKGFVILHECVKCGHRQKAKAITNDANASDDFDIILRLSANPIDEK